MRAAVDPALEAPGQVLLLDQESSFEEERRALLPLSHSIPWEHFVKGIHHI